MRIKLYILIGCLSIFIISCKSTPSKELLTSDDCLIVIKTEVIKDRTSDTARTYSIHLTGEDYSILIPNKESSYIAFKIRSDQVDIQNITSRVTDRNYEGDSSRRTIAKLLPLPAGSNRSYRL